ncbi:ATP-binding protein [Kitasatospora sp. LaBMicrA B282]|uniref:ATP-binding protein n=1 Tax=Kitasatospora sp. LaBMicrA B282 TaxID=3420949 RepID=UPI003D0C6F45
MPNEPTFPVPQQWDVEPSAAAVRSARHLVLGIARFWQVPLSTDALRDVELCTSELLANAVEHTKARCKVTVRWTGLRLRVEVADTSLRLPDPDAAQDTVTGGRGLMVVEGLSHSWGWEPSGAGKVVWFEMASDQTVTGDGRLSVLVRAAHTDVLARESTPAA